MSVFKLIEANENLSFSFENQYKRFSYLSFLPIQVNSGTSEIKDLLGNNVSRPWFQLVSYYKNSFMSVDENGVVGEDNATIKMLFVKFSYELIQQSGFTGEQLRKFFNDFYVGKKFLTLPVTEEMPVFSIDAKNPSNKTIVKNQSQVNVSLDFDLKSFILDIQKSAKK